MLYNNHNTNNNILFDAYVVDFQKISRLPQKSHELEYDTVIMQHFDWIGIVDGAAEMAIRLYYCKIHVHAVLMAIDDLFHSESILN